MAFPARFLEFNITVHEHGPVHPHTHTQHHWHAQHNKSLPLKHNWQKLSAMFSTHLYLSRLCGTWGHFFNNRQPHFSFFLPSLYSLLLFAICHPPPPCSISLGRLPLYSKAYFFYFIHTLFILNPQHGETKMKRTVSQKIPQQLYKSK